MNASRKINSVNDMYEENVEEVLNHIREKLEEIDYGTITIKLMGDTSQIDIITEKRERFKKR